MSRSAVSDYYAVLQVPRTATAEEIKLAYRARAKELHPDRNRHRNTTAAFQQLQEAYAVLGSAERRRLYDEGNIAAAVDPATPATEADFEPFACDGCGQISAQPRYMSYAQVLGLIIAADSRVGVGVFCPRCASKRLFFSTFVTTVTGLPSRGISDALAALQINLKGGEISPGTNVFLLGRQAKYFHRQRRPDLAEALAADALEMFRRSRPTDVDYPMGLIGRDHARGLVRPLERPPRRLRSRWKGWSVPARWALVGFSPLLLLFGSCVALEVTTGLRRARVDPAPAYAAQRPTIVPAPKPDVEVTGEDGRVYRLPYSVFVAMSTRRTYIATQRKVLETRGDELERRRGLIELARASMPTADSERRQIFNREVDSWNTAVETLRSDYAKFNATVSIYNRDLEASGTLITSPAPR